MSKNIGVRSECEHVSDGLHALQRENTFTGFDFSGRKRFIAEVQNGVEQFNTTASLLCGNTRTFCVFLSLCTPQPARLGGNVIDT